MIEQVTVGVDVGCHRHRVAIAAPDGKFVEEFDIPADSEGCYTENATRKGCVKQG